MNLVALLAASLALATVRAEQLAVLDATCSPDTLSRSKARQTLACFIQLDRRPPRGSTCSWEWGVGYSTTEVCRGETESARREYRLRDLTPDAVGIRFAVFAQPSGALLVDRTVVVEVVD